MTGNRRKGQRKDNSETNMNPTERLSKTTVELERELEIHNTHLVDLLTLEQINAELVAPLVEAAQPLAYWLGHDVVQGQEGASAHALVPQVADAFLSHRGVLHHLRCDWKGEV